jgi:hypothetical protein
MAPLLKAGGRRYASGQLVASQDDAGKLDATGQLTGSRKTTRAPLVQSRVM